MTKPNVTADPECAGLFRSIAGAQSSPFCLLVLCAGDLALARLRLQELADQLAAEERIAPLREEHAATDLPTETRRVIHCVVQDHLTPAIDDLLGFVLHPLDEDPREAS